MLIGTVLMVSPKGFGFIRTEGGNVYFRHNGEFRRGDTVRYEVQEVDGRPRAVNVSTIDPAILREIDRVFGA